jgi:hypothetical protein
MFAIRLTNEEHQKMLELLRLYDDDIEQLASRLVVAERDLTALKERLKGRVVVPVTITPRYGGGYGARARCTCQNVEDCVVAIGGTQETAHANLQQFYDEEANHG